MKAGIAKADAIVGITTDLHDEQIAPEIGTELTHAIVQESQVDVEYRRREDGTRYVRIKVFVPSKKGLFRFTDVACAGNTREAMARKCDKAAGAISEQLVVMYGSACGVDPAECAKKAREHFLELCEVLARQSSQEASV